MTDLTPDAVLVPQIFVVASNPFVAEDAAQHLAQVRPDSRTRVFDHPDLAADALDDIQAPVDVVVIGPRWELAKTALARTLARRGGTMIVFSSEIEGDLPCRVLWGEMPYTEQTLTDLVGQALAPA